MIKIQNPLIFAECVASTLGSISGNASLSARERLRAAIITVKAARRIASDGAFMDFDGDGDRLVIWSQSSNKIYELTGSGICKCPAGQRSALCWHQSAKRLIEHYNAAMLIALCSEYVAGKSLETRQPKTAVVDQLPSIRLIENPSPAVASIKIEKLPKPSSQEASLDSPKPCEK